MEKILSLTLPKGKFLKVSSLRSGIMRAIRGRNNKSTEGKLMSAFIQEGIKGWRRHPKAIVGTPDFYFPQKRLAVFVDGCFWHGCPKCGHIPKTRSHFWATKISRTQLRHRRVKLALKKQDINVLRIWEHSLKSDTSIIKTIYKIKGFLR